MTRSDKLSVGSLMLSILAIFIGWMSYDALSVIQSKTTEKNALVDKHEQYLNMIAPIQHTHTQPTNEVNK